MCAKSIQKCTKKKISLLEKATENSSNFINSEKYLQIVCKQMKNAREINISLKKISEKIVKWKFNNFFITKIVRDI